jgi:phage terminase small subunit
MKITRPNQDEIDKISQWNQEKDIIDRLAPRKPTKKTYIKVRRFVSEYMIDHNAVAAYKRCGYGTGNYNADAIAAHQLLHRGDVEAIIENMEEKRNQKANITAQKILDELALLAFADLSQIATWDGYTFVLKPFCELTRDQIALISSIKIIPKQNGGIDLEFKTPSAMDKKQALVDLGVYMGYFKREGDAKKTEIDPDDLAKKIRMAQRQMDEKDGIGLKLVEKKKRMEAMG